MRKIYQSVYRFIKSYFKPLGELLPLSGILVHPCFIDGKQSLIYENGLKQKDPEAYRYIINYARLNKLNLKEDLRNSFERVKNERRKNVMPMMALGASMLFSKPVLASSILDMIDDDTEVTTQIGHKSHAESKQDEMVKELLGWVGKNSSFDIDVSELPNVMRVSSNEMLKAAFNNMLPQKVDSKKFEIYGLYNFRDKTVYILDSIDMESEEGKGILLHELVHYLQYEYGNDKDVNCKNELERLAYMLEAEYLDDHGHRASFSEKYVKSVSKCA